MLAARGTEGKWSRGKEAQNTLLPIYIHFDLNLNRVTCRLRAVPASLIECNTGCNTGAYLLIRFNCCTFSVRFLKLQNPEFRLNLSQTRIKMQTTSAG